MRKLKEKKGIVAWIIGVFFILTFMTYYKQNPIPSILILFAGVILLPPINRMIKRNILDEKKLRRYNLLRNMIIISFACIFFYSVSLLEDTHDYNITKSYITDSSQNILKTDTNNEKINQNVIDESISKIITETNGKYTGERIDGKKEGKGKFEWNDGAVYEGEFSNDMINGQGKLMIPNKGTYEGYFVNGKKNGQGKYVFYNDDIYEGNWVDDKMSGKGKYTFANGDIYEGEFLNNQFNGEGTYTKGENKYTGKWSNNEYIE